MRVNAFIALLLVQATTLAAVNNGDFEQWSNGAPVAWDLIDSGISLAAVSQPVVSGARAAAVTLNTSSQSNADLRQSIDVVAGESYAFSVQVRHTEGGARARLFVDGYTDAWSNAALTGQWQTLNVNYTAASAGAIEVGLRFYDVSGFDGSEVIYIDDYQPGEVGGACAATTATLELLTDNYGSETSWQLRDASNLLIASGAGYASNSVYSEAFCLADGDYQFTIADSYGDGICCGYGNGSYSLSTAEQLLASGGGFASTEATLFTIESTACSENELLIKLNTDDYAEETSWQLIDSNNQSVATGADYVSNRQYEEALCLADGDYQFQIFDSYDDGICCAYGNGSYSLELDGAVLASGGEFTSSESVSLRLGASAGGGDYYASAEGLTGYALKTALHQIIDDHTVRGYGALWDFYSSHELDVYYEGDGSILDIYSENPAGSDSYNYVKVTNQCGSYNSEADCYNREHSFPRSWFGGSIEPMNSDVHHIFASDGYVNAQRGSYPLGEVGSAFFVSENGSMAGSSAVGTGYSGTVFEPIDEFKGDLARAYFYMATRYEDAIAAWQGNSSFADAALNGSSEQVFETWLLGLLKQWHVQDPVSQKERDRNEAAYLYQGNRNPFVDRPEFVGLIWGD
jgi:endonuclease I